jgi:hypothetical protein
MEWSDNYFLSRVNGRDAANLFVEGRTELADAGANEFIECGV